MQNRPQPRTIRRLKLDEVRQALSSGDAGSSHPSLEVKRLSRRVIDMERAALRRPPAGGSPGPTA